ncbi:protein-L-isoaspartate(D-aspartate) O-methyltransferase [Blastopirellula marina]|uniref:Protein-L-isoaspartate O-methyltransferase n=1 Tax=Blastopirellula marina TaxID=124 RepID=A0A2S8FHW5_9BACT|nr:protein-L-isoaspartate(D-aspartate) O-methyltransferase [Blastopirellula marina]PQO31741.1 protein-L-isoaspartate O-methyltransferase [Blastopirellula marina]PTL43048.1 protein-L-isoaspartate(D-aspartate) O-methyltransferase [Blastopirellula marina]
MDLQSQCEAMLAQLSERGIDDPKVLAAMKQVPREAFVLEEFRADAYRDSALPLTHQQTISQPFIVALMAQALELKPSDRTLEIGAGSGYAAAVLGRLCQEVFTVERVGDLAISAAETIRKLGMANVHVRFGDGTKGWPAEAPFDAISVAAGGTRVPNALVDQLAIGGRLVIPLGRAADSQKLVRIRKLAKDRYKEDDLGAVRFVPLLPDTD